MDWVIVNYYMTGETFTVCESEFKPHSRYGKLAPWGTARRQLMKQIKFCLPLILGFVQLFK